MGLYEVCTYRKPEITKRIYIIAFKTIDLNYSKSLFPPFDPTRNENHLL